MKEQEYIVHCELRVRAPNKMAAAAQVRTVMLSAATAVRDWAVTGIVPAEDAAPYLPPSVPDIRPVPAHSP